MPLPAPLDAFSGFYVEPIPDDFDAAMTVHEVLRWSLRALPGWDELAEDAVPPPVRRIMASLAHFGCAPDDEALSGARLEQMLWRFRLTYVLAPPELRRSEVVLSSAVIHCAAWLQLSSPTPKDAAPLLDMATSLLAVFQRASAIEVALAAVALSEALGLVDAAGRDRVLRRQVLERSLHTETLELGVALLDKAERLSISAARLAVARFRVARLFEQSKPRAHLEAVLVDADFSSDEILDVVRVYIEDLQVDDADGAFLWLMDHLDAPLPAGLLSRLVSLADRRSAWPRVVTALCESGRIESPKMAEMWRAMLPVLEQIEHAEALSERGGHAEALRVLRGLPREGLEDLELERRRTTVLARVHLALGQYEQTLATLRRLDQTPESIAWCGRALFAMGRFPEAIEQLELAFHSGFEGSVEALCLARAHLTEGRFADAEQWLDVAGSGTASVRVRLVESVLQRAHELALQRPLEARGLLGIAERQADTDPLRLSWLISAVALDVAFDEPDEARQRLGVALSSPDFARLFVARLLGRLHEKASWMTLILEHAPPLLLERYPERALVRLFAARAAEALELDDDAIQTARAGLTVARSADDFQTAAQLSAIAARAMIRRFDALGAAELLLDSLQTDALHPSLLMAMAHLMPAMGGRGFQAWLNEAGKRLSKERLEALMEALSDPVKAAERLDTVQPAESAASSVYLGLLEGLGVNQPRVWMAGMEPLISVLLGLETGEQRGVANVIQCIDRFRRGEPLLATTLPAGRALVASVPHPMTEMPSRPSPWRVRPIDRASAAMSDDTSGGDT